MTRQIQLTAAEHSSPITVAQKSQYGIAEYLEVCGSLLGYFLHGETQQTFAPPL
jgi:hypothetical protein